jgi:hypothetical protein
MVGMGLGQGDPCWEAFVGALLAVGHASERRSRFADKSALFIGNREFAHSEAPGVIDLRITRAGWSRAREEFDQDAAVQRDPARRDWIALHLASAAVR